MGFITDADMAGSCATTQFSATPTTLPLATFTGFASTLNTGTLGVAAITTPGPPSLIALSMTLG